MKLIHATLLALAVLSGGCKALNNHVMVGTATVLGFRVAQNPATQLYQAELGYARSEFALVPTNGPDVLTELEFHSILSTGGLYQRMAVGKDAVKSSMFMFAKDSNGTLNPQNATAVSQAIIGIPLVNTGGTAAKAPLATLYSNAVDKTKFDTVAQSLGYKSYVDFLLNPSLTADQVNAMKAALATAGIQ